jgi:hypothetical protein
MNARDVKGKEKRQQEGGSSNDCRENKVLAVGGVRVSLLIAV